MKVVVNSSEKDPTSTHWYHTTRITSAHTLTLGRGKFRLWFWLLPECRSCALFQSVWFCVLPYCLFSLVHTYANGTKHPPNNSPYTHTVNNQMLEYILQSVISSKTFLPPKICANRQSKSVMAFRKNLFVCKWCLIYYIYTDANSNHLYNNNQKPPLPRRDKSSNTTHTKTYTKQRHRHVHKENMINNWNSY